MERKLLRDQKREIFSPIFTKARRSRGKEVSILSYYDPKTMKKLWKTRGYFAQDIRRFMPPDLTIRSAQRCGTFLKTDDLLMILGRGKNKKTFVGERHKKKLDLTDYDQLPPTKWPKHFKGALTAKLFFKEDEGTEFYAQILDNKEVFVYKSVQV